MLVETGLAGADLLLTFNNFMLLGVVVDRP
jgi:hypothetical protein